MVTSRTWFTPKQKAELWERWKSGQCVADMPGREVRTNRTQAPQQPTSPTDHLVGASEREGRISRPSRPGGRQIDNEIELGRLLDWNVGRLRPAQNRRASDQLSNSYRLFVRLNDTA